MSFGIGSIDILGHSEKIWEIVINRQKHRQAEHISSPLANEESLCKILSQKQVYASVQVGTIKF